MVTISDVSMFFKNFTPDFDHPKGDHDLNGKDFYPEKTRDAAVLILLVRKGAGEEAQILLTQRTDHLAHHPGQISFPGGRCEKQDENVIMTALRETEEEVGIDPAFIDVIGELTPYITRTGFRIHPIVGVISAPYFSHPDPHEVAEIFEVPLSFLLNETNHIKESRIFEGKARYFWAMPYEERYIWGATAGIIRDFYDCLKA